MRRFLFVVLGVAAAALVTQPVSNVWAAKTAGGGNKGGGSGNSGRSFNIGSSGSNTAGILRSAPRTNSSVSSSVDYKAVYKPNPTGSGNKPSWIGNDGVRPRYPTGEGGGHTVFKIPDIRIPIITPPIVRPQRPNLTIYSNSPQPTYTPGLQLNDPAPSADVQPADNTPVLADEEPADNSGYADVVDFTADDQQQMVGQLQSDVQQSVQDGKDAVTKQTKSILDNHQPPLTPQQKQNISDAVASGDPSKVTDALSKINSGVNPNSTEAVLLKNQAKANGQLDAVGAAAANGNATPTQISDLRQTLSSAGVPDTANLNVTNSLANGSAAINMANTAQPGQNPLPLGGLVPILLAGGLPAGTIVPFGNGAVMIGTSGATDGVMVGTGDPLEVAGCALPIGPPVPDRQGDRVQPGAVLLLNVAKNPVNYNVNDGPFAMQPGFSQELPAGQDWTVSFDRGGGSGIARYGLTPGTYEFTQTSTGWELYQQTYTAKLDNRQNKSPFNFVVDGQRQSLPAGQAGELSSPYPIQIRFDDGHHQVKEKKLRSGEFKVGLSRDNTLDLFPPQSLKAPATKNMQITGRKSLPQGFSLFKPAATYDAANGDAAALVEKTPAPLRKFFTSSKLADSTPAPPLPAIAE